jgi:hypothetical protein
MTAAGVGSPYEIRGSGPGHGEAYRACTRAWGGRSRSGPRRARLDGARRRPSRRPGGGAQPPGILILHDPAHTTARPTSSPALEGRPSGSGCARDRNRRGAGAWACRSFTAWRRPWKGIVHCDLAKPLHHERRPHAILDFGLACWSLGPIATSDSNAPTADSPTRQGTILGTIGYASPEQAQGKPVDARTDIFSFGAVLYEMVTGHRAFDGDSQVSVLSAILTGTPPAAGSLRPGVPAELDDILKRCLEKDPERRYPSADGLRKELAACLDALLHHRISLRALIRNPRLRFQRPCCSQ